MKHKNPFATVAVAVIIVASLLLSACSTNTGNGGTSSTQAAKLTMWVRTGGPEDDAQQLTTEYNKTHDTQIELTIIPADSYLQKVGAAAGSNSLPDLLSSDVVYATNYARQGIYADITDKINSLPYANMLAQAHVQAAMNNSMKYAVPFVVDSSFLMYNKSLFEKAGLDPNKPLQTYDDIYAAAKAITGVEPGVYGFGFDGNCAGCFAYTVFANAAAGGNPPISLDGTKADIDNDSMASILGLYRSIYQDGYADPAAKAGDGSSWNGPFVAGKIGLLPTGTYTIPSMTNAGFDWGYFPLTNKDGTKSATFVGGDVIGISSSSKQQDAAWDFLSWSMSDDVQVEIVIKNGGLPVRTDLAENKYTTDPRMKDIIAGMGNGYTPPTPAYGSAINDGNGPWLVAVRGAIFGDDPAAALADGQKAIQALIDNMK